MIRKSGCRFSLATTGTRFARDHAQTKNQGAAMADDSDDKTEDPTQKRSTTRMRAEMCQKPGSQHPVRIAGATLVLSTSRVRWAAAS
jgi:hypothetical protein